MRRQTRAVGFTLIEVLVAISIFALIGVASYRVLSGVMQTDERLAARSEALRQTNRAFWTLQQDIEQIAQRRVRDQAGVTRDWLLVDEKSALPLQFSRAGRANPLGLPRSDLQRVAYKVDRHPDYEKEGSPFYRDERTFLLRYTWPMLDGSGDPATALVQVLLPDVERMTVTVQSTRGLLNHWPPLANGLAATPTAVRIALQHAQWGQIEHVYKVF
jgi:general secretion pathway protein J